MLFQDSTFCKSSLSVSTPKHLRRAAPKQVQSIKMCDMPLEQDQSINQLINQKTTTHENDYCFTIYA